MECSNCNKKILPQSIYCPFCASQVKCKSCDVQIIKDSIACYNCGTLVEKAPEQKTEENESILINTIKYIENKDERSFEATFTDNIGENISQSFGAFLANNLPPVSKNKQISQSNDNIIESEEVDFEDFEELDNSSKTENLPKKPKTNINKDVSTSTISTYLNEAFSDIFKEKNDTLILMEYRLKAKNKKDFGNRLTLLYTFAKEFIIGKPASRREIGKFLTPILGDYTETGKWLLKTPFFSKDGQIFHISNTGKTEVEKILSEISNDTIENKWDISKNTTGEKSKSAPETFNLVDLGLSEEKRLELKDFHSSKSPKKQNDLITIVIYWLDKNTIKSNFTFDEIYTCIQYIGVKTPKRLKAVCNNTVGENKIKSHGDGTYSISNVGSDYVKFDLPVNT